METRFGVTAGLLFLSNLPVIDEVVGQVCRRHRLSASEAEDFASDVHGRRPFGGITPFETANAILIGRRNQLPSEVLATVRGWWPSAISVWLEERHQSASDLAAALDEVL
jgi:hypothetical protein